MVDFQWAEDLEPQIRSALGTHCQVSIGVSFETSLCKQRKKTLCSKTNIGPVAGMFTFELIILHNSVSKDRVSRLSMESKGVVTEGYLMHNTEAMIMCSSPQLWYLPTMFPRNLLKKLLSSNNS